MTHSQFSVKFIFSGGLQLNYILNNTKAAAVWLDIFKQMRPEFLLRPDLNGPHGFAEECIIKARIHRLQWVAKELGFSLADINKNNWHTHLNALHVHFPAALHMQHTARFYSLYHELNLTIHWLEYELGNLYEDRKQFLVNVDFNHFPAAYRLKQPFDENELPLYSPNLEFGNLHLHYIYIGRHFLEMADVQDFESPKAHFRPQWEFNATCGLVFSEPQDASSVSTRLQRYYEQRGGEAFFGYRFDDHRLAKGFFTVAKLENAAAYSTQKSRDALRKAIKNQHAVGWRIT